MLKSAGLSFLLSTIVFLTLVVGLVPAQGQQKYVFQQPKMGSPFIITIYGTDSTKIAQTAKAAFLRIDTLNSIFSDYLDSSELNKLSRTSGSGRLVPVSPDMYTLLNCAINAACLSKGSFDITVGPLVRLWRKARKLKVAPKPDSIKNALLAVGYHHLHLDWKHQSVRLEKPHMQLDLGGIAKGYTAQMALQLIEEAGFPSAMVDAGGDLALGSPPSGHRGWHIGIGFPGSNDELLHQMLEIKHKAVATSGDAYQFLEWHGKRYSHIINPKTGWGVTHQRNVTVIANDGATADWLASACSVLPIPRAMRLVEKIPGAALLITEKRENHLYRKASPGFPQDILKEKRPALESTVPPRA